MALKKRTVIIIAAVGTLLGLLFGIMLVTIIRLTVSGTRSEEPMIDVPTENLTLDNLSLPTPYISEVTKMPKIHNTTTETLCYCPCSCYDPTAVKDYKPNGSKIPQSRTESAKCKPSKTNIRSEPEEPEEPEKEPEEEKPEQKQKENKKKKEKSANKVFDSEDKGKPEKGGKDDEKNIGDGGKSKTVEDSNKIIKDIPEIYAVSTEPEILVEITTDEKLTENQKKIPENKTKSVDKKGEEKENEIMEDNGDHETEDIQPDDEEYDEDYGEQENRKDEGDNSVLAREDSTGDNTQYINNDSDSDENPKEESNGNKGKVDRQKGNKGKVDRQKGVKGKVDREKGDKGKVDRENEDAGKQIA